MMKRILFVFAVAITISCGAPVKETNPVIIGNDENIILKDDNEIIPIVVEPKIPQGAISANFISAEIPFYAAVEKVNKKKGIITVGFEIETIPKIHIQESYGAELIPVRFEEFDRDLLLVKTTYKDPIFRKYYLYILDENSWKPVVDGFILHVDNVSETLPIAVNPTNSEQMIRQYSVFDLDANGATKYQWILHEESVRIQNN